MAADYSQGDFIEKRVRYFDGQFLKDQDFIDEQKYHLDRQRRPLQFLYTPGIVDGLTIEMSNMNDRAVVTPGTAIDVKGRQIVLSSNKNLPLKEYRNQTIEVFIAYREVASDMAQEGGESNRRWHEDPEITVQKTGESPPGNAIRLAKLNLNGDGNVTHDADQTVRQYAGIKLPTADGANLSLRSRGMAGSSWVTLNGSLNVTDRVGIGTTSPNAKLEVKLASASTESSLKLDHGASNLIVRPLTTAASSVIENTGAGALVINPNGGNVGIGATDPKSSLSVKGGMAIGTNYANTNTAPVNSLLVEGNVGIGTPTPQSKLRVLGGNLGIDYGESGYLWVAPEEDWSKGTHKLLGVEWLNNADTVKLHTPGRHRPDPVITFDSNGKVSLGGKDKSTEAVTIQADGNVGIGTPTPQSKLRVLGGSLGIDYGESGYLQVAPEVDWPQGTHKLLGVEWLNNADTVKLHTPGSQRPDPVITFDSSGKVSLGGKGKSIAVTIDHSGDLTAAGKITAQTGGFVFPDKTVQSTAVRISSGVVEFGESKGNGIGRPESKFSSDVTFKQKYASPPSIHLSLSRIDSDQRYNLRLYTYADSITTSGFRIYIVIWADTIIYTANISWIAFGS